MKKKNNTTGHEALTPHITYRIIDSTIYLFQNGENIIEEELLIASKKLSPLVEDNDISNINISAKNIENRKEFYQNLGFTLSFYDVGKLNVLHSDKKNKMDYRCYGIMTRKDFFNKMKEKKAETSKIEVKGIRSNSGYVNSLLLLFGGIILLCYFCIEGAILLVK